ncbi:hypothetical protein V5O48_009070 [Marasmius crinis-equi]|uniref:Uncharacterized protein n=1 Tax=Marasmius crinis-equi TaxID=585013 RepID=A0ABR3FCB6_9AGAR
MVQLTDEAQPPAPAPNSHSSGLIVTTTVEVRLKHPNGYTVSATQDDASNVAAASDDEDDNDPSSAPTTELPTYHVPLPTSFVRPENEDDIKRFHVIFAGKQVGIFPGEWEDVVAPLVKGVPNNRTEGYGSFDDAVYQYARAYQGKRKGWRVRVIGSPVRVEYDGNYQWGNGEMLGSVDITGLDISRELVTTVA